MVMAEQGLRGRSKTLLCWFWGLSSLKWKKVCPGIGTDATQGEIGDHQDSGSFSDADNPFLYPHSSPPLSFSECKQPENSRHLQQTKSSGTGGQKLAPKPMLSPGEAFKHVISHEAKGGINLYQYLLMAMIP